MQVDNRPSRGLDAAERQHIIVVGYDGSSESQAALATAAARVGKGGTVVAVHAAGAAWWLERPHHGRVVEMRREHAARILDELSSLELADVKVETELVDGPAAEALTEVAKRRDAEEIVVGSRRLGWLHAMLGSVSRRVLQLADRPVVVVSRMSRGSSAADSRHESSALPLGSPISTHSFRF
jgi:nucleotide-binding universal stress UspA family protein